MKESSDDGEIGGGALKREVHDQAFQLGEPGGERGREGYPHRQTN